MSNNDFGNTPNPYQSVTVPSAEPQTVKPVSMTVFGILNLVFGLMGLCGVAFASAQWALMSTGQMATNPIWEQMNSQATYAGLRIVLLGVGFIFTIVLVVAGVGLLNGKPYGRTLSMAYGIYGIIASVVEFVVNAIFLTGPLIEQADTMPEGPERIGIIVGAVSVTVGSLCSLAYPIILLIFMMRAPLVNYMRGRQQPA